MGTRTAKEAIEQFREYWDRRSCNIRHSRAELGTRRYSDEVEARKYSVDPYIPRYTEFEKWTGERVLEIGCGIGTDIINSAKAGVGVTAVDLPGDAAHIAEGAQV